MFTTAAPNHDRDDDTHVLVCEVVPYVVAHDLVDVEEREKRMGYGNQKRWHLDINRVEPHRVHAVLSLRVRETAKLSVHVVVCTSKRDSIGTKRCSVSSSV